MKTSSWERPQTTRRYLHPPKAERMFTLWREGKIIYGDVVRVTDNDGKHYHELVCSGIWLTFSKYAQMFDFRRVKCFQPGDGIPIHGLWMEYGGLEVTMEAFCNIERKPTCFSKIVVTNRAPYKVRDCIGLIPRTGCEKKMVFGSPDEYVSYAPEVSVFKNAPITFEEQDGVLWDGDVFITTKADTNLRYDKEQGILWAEICLDAGECTELILSFGRGETFEFDYEDEKAKTVAFWEKELAKINRLPKNLCEEEIRIIKNLTVQMLQCFCYYKDEGALLQRQGGLQRLIWPWESMAVLESLSRIGDFADYIEPVIETYFDEMQLPNGEIRAIGESWACNTADCIQSFANYCLNYGGKAFYEKYKDAAYRAFLWLRNTRRKTKGDSNVFEGLFPPMRACDWAESSQMWSKTDVFNIYGIRELARAAKEFGDERSSEMWEEHDSYMAVMKAIWEPMAQAAKEQEVLRMPLVPDGNDEALIRGFYPYLTQGGFIYTGIVSEEDIIKVRNYMYEDGLAKNGLYGHMPYPNGDTHIWYVNWPEYYWYLAFLRMDKKEWAKEIYEAQLKYAMTDEYYMVERYSDRDPWYVPWSPNASASGRTILLILEGIM